jgi:hypothetical protein
MSRDEDFSPLEWAAKRIPRAEARRWWRAGYSVAEALRWLEHYSVEEALLWRKAGITRVAEAQSWRVAGVEAGAVRGWIAAGIGFAEAAAWNEFDYSLDEARKLKAEGKTPGESFRNRVQRMRSSPTAHRALPRGSSSGSMSRAAGRHPVQDFLEKLHRTPHGRQLMHGYLQQQWLDDEAVKWASEGIEAPAAILWKEFGVSPVDAAAATKDGQTPAATIRAWWEAGIPPGEFAAWLGAGLSPEEAAAQRADGVGADRAAVLRALRRLDEA